MVFVCDECDTLWELIDAIGTDCWPGDLKTYLEDHGYPADLNEVEEVPMFLGEIGVEIGVEL
jgi:hypothetical protein